MRSLGSCVVLAPQKKKGHGDSSLDAFYKTYLVFGWCYLIEFLFFSSHQSAYRECFDSVSVISFASNDDRLAFETTGLWRHGLVSGIVR